MLKQARKVFCIAVIIIAFMFNPIICIKVQAETTRDNAVQVYVQKDVKVNDLDIEPINTQEVKKTVVPDVKNEWKKVFSNFLKAMMIVLFSGVIVYLILLFVKKYYGSVFVATDDDEYFETLDMTTPDNRPDALKSFLHRTK